MIHYHKIVCHSKLKNILYIYIYNFKKNTIFFNIKKKNDLTDVFIKY